MRKIKLIVVVCLVSVCVFGQSDSTNVGNINGQIQTVLLPDIFNLLGSFGINLTPFAGIIAALIMWIIRKVEKSTILKNHETIVNSMNFKNDLDKREVINDLKAAGQDTSLPMHHLSFYNKLINKIENTF